jgi:DNA polymerase-1
MKTVVCDIETDGLDATKIWVVVCKDLETGQLDVFRMDESDPTKHLLDFERYAQSVTSWIGHNFLSFDLPVIKRLVGIDIPVDKVQDTLILARFIRPGKRNSLEVLGELIGFPKTSLDTWQVLTDEMVEYCINDVEVNHKLYRWLEPRLRWFSEHSIRLEHDHQAIMNQQKRDGFPFDLEGAIKLKEELERKRSEAESLIWKDLKPIVIPGELVTPKETLSGEVHMQGVKRLGNYKSLCEAGVPLQHIEFQPFDLNSPKQIVKRLEPFWTPVIRTKGGEKTSREFQSGRLTEEEFREKSRYQWKVCDENLETISEHAPRGLQKLRERAVLKARIDTLSQLVAATGSDLRVRGEVISLGATTHRCAHREPNLANIPARGSSLYASEIRSLFRVEERSHSLLGVDASGIQLRLLAHYLNSEIYTQVVTRGQSSDRSDVHSYNWRTCFNLPEDYWVSDENREKSKTNIYSWIFGAGESRTANILGLSRPEAREVRKRLVHNTPGLKQFIDEIVKPAARKGFVKAIDGRLIPVESKHLVVAVLLQSAEAIVMKEAQRKWVADATRLGIPFWLCAFVHDEWQTETFSDMATELGQLKIESIRWAGELFELNCPLDGQAQIGNSWKETH